MECAALQGFPAAWQFVGPLASRFRQIGNAVPSIFGEVLGNALLQSIRGGRTLKPVSAPFPRGFASAIDYTTRENRRNGESRRAVRTKLQNGDTEVRALKGLGSADRSETDRFGESEC